MLDRVQWVVQEVFLSRTMPLTPVGSLGDLLSLPQIQLQPPGGRGWYQITLAEFQPIALQIAASPAHVTGSTGSVRPRRSPSRRRAFRVGDICPVCNAEVRERPLLNKTFVGCLC
jgi:hypothetical protein